MDDAQKKVDSELKKTEKELTEIYEEAVKDLQGKWDKYIEGYKDKADRLSEEMNNALDSGDDEAYAKAKEAYENFMMPKIRRNTYYTDMVNQMTDQLAHVNQTSLDIVNGKLPDVYTISYNNFDKESKNVSGYSFSLVDRNTVVDLFQDKKLKLPAKKLDVPKDKKWNTKKINSQMLQGVLQGESMDKIAKRLRNVTDMNKVSAIRNARTMTTSAECKGRQDSYEQAIKDGIKMKRVWLSAHDARTRDWHSELNGQAVEVDEPFTNSIGKIMYPGDPSAHPANVYNCRCSIKAKILGFVPSEEYLEEEESFEEYKIDNRFTNLSGIDVGDLSKMDDTLREMGLQEINDILDDFEKAKPFLTSIEPMSDDADLFDVGGYEPFGSMRINTEYYSDYNESVRDYEEDIRNNRTSGIHPVNLFSHEMGHVLERAYMSVEGEGYDEKDWNSGKYAKEIFKQVRSEMGITKEQQDQLIKKLSKYATESPSEALGECISNYRAYGDDGNELAVATYKFLKNKLGKDYGSNVDNRISIEEPSRHVPVQGKDLTNTWERRKDQFDFEIDDVINAQGFDGLPRVVSADEFDKCVKESNFIAQRTYSAPNPEILEVYREQLYNGDWYVDCSTGGCIYGKGMYTASVNDTLVSEPLVKAMDSYNSWYEKKLLDDDLLLRLNKERLDEGDRLYSIGKIDDAKKIYDMNTLDFGKMYHPDLMPTSTVETLTLSPDAKTINFMDLKEKMIDEGLGKSDAGAYAALKGYDAIIAKGAGGVYGKDLDYTIILNRTKVIIKGE